MSKSDLCRIVIVEDNEADVYLVETALEESRFQCEMQVCSSGGAAFELIRQLDTSDLPAPDLLLLDLNLPQYGGEEILKRFRQCAKGVETPVIVMTSSDSPRERSRVEAMGAVFFVKPTDLAQFMKLGDVVRTALAGSACQRTEAPRPDRF